MYLFPAKKMHGLILVFLLNGKNEILFRTYNFRKSIENNILYLVCAKSHLLEDIKNLSDKNGCYYILVPPGLISICQPVDLYVNKPFKDALKAKYRKFFDFLEKYKKTPEDLIE